MLISSAIQLIIYFLNYLTAAVAHTSPKILHFNEHNYSLKEKSKLSLT